MKHLTDKIDACRAIVANLTAAEIDGVLVDMQTANAIVTLYDNLSERNRLKFVEEPIGVMGGLAWEILGKAQERQS